MSFTYYTIHKESVKKDLMVIIHIMLEGVPYGHDNTITLSYQNKTINRMIYSPALWCFEYLKSVSLL